MLEQRLKNKTFKPKSLQTLQTTNFYQLYELTVGVANYCF